MVMKCPEWVSLNILKVHFMVKRYQIECKRKRMYSLKFDIEVALIKWFKNGLKMVYQYFYISEHFRKESHK